MCGHESYAFAALDIPLMNSKRICGVQLLESCGARRVHCKAIPITERNCSTSTDAPVRHTATHTREKKCVRKDDAALYHLGSFMIDGRDGKFVRGSETGESVVSATPVSLKRKKNILITWDRDKNSESGVNIAQLSWRIETYLGIYLIYVLAVSHD